MKSTSLSGRPSPEAQRTSSRRRNPARTEPVIRGGAARARAYTRVTVIRPGQPQTRSGGPWVASFEPSCHPLRVIRLILVRAVTDQPKPATDDRVKTGHSSGLVYCAGSVVGAVVSGGGPEGRPRPVGRPTLRQVPGGRPCTAGHSLQVPSSFVSAGEDELLIVEDAEGGVLTTWTRSWSSGHRFVRYADDIRLHVRSERASERILAGIAEFIEKRLKLRVNRQKSSVKNANQATILGFGFHRRDGEVRIRIAPQALERLHQRVRELTARTWSIAMEERISRLNRYLTGWGSYFGLAETPSTFERIDSWLRHRLRQVRWTEWKRPAARQHN